MIDAKEEKSLELFPAKFGGVTMCNKRAITEQERRRRGRGRETCELSMDLMIEILIRMPAKSLMRFKCVSKQWSSLISCQYFRHRLFTRRQQQQPYLFMSLMDEDIQRVLLTLSSTSPNKSCFVVNQELAIPRMRSVLNIAYGLICFKVGKQVCIYNPATTQLLTLPSLKSDFIVEIGEVKDTRYYIGYDRLNHQYNILCTIAISSGILNYIKSEHWVFVFEAGSSWKKVVVPMEDYHPHCPLALGLFMNGSVIHYAAWTKVHTCAVASFDIRSKRLTTIPLPWDAMHLDRVVPLPAVTMKVDVIEYGGKVAVFDCTHLKDKGKVYIWVLEDAEKKKWSTRKLVLQTCQRHLLHDSDVEVKGTTKDGKVVLAPWKFKMCSQFYILLYDIQLNDLRKVEIKGVPHPWFDKVGCSDFKLMDYDNENSFCFKSLNC